VGQSDCAKPRGTLNQRRIKAEAYEPVSQGWTCDASAYIKIECVFIYGVKAISVRQRPLVWLNLACLDAPLVAVAWQWLFARSFQIAVSASARNALFLTAWLIYLIDRLVDSLSLPPDSARSLREQFCLHHTKLWLGLIAAIAILDAGIVLLSLDRTLLLPGACLGGVAFVYLTVNYAFNELWEIIPLKEVTIGFLFAAGTLLVLFPELSVATPFTARWTGTFVLLLFISLCSLNCMSIAVWERGLDRGQKKHSIATRWPALDFSVRISCFLLALASAVLATASRQFLPLAMCLSVSATLLTILHSISIQRDERVALADLVLLTPAALLFAELIL
jgi:hypothetical protein